MKQVDNLLLTFLLEKFYCSVALFVDQFLTLFVICKRLNYFSYLGTLVLIVTYLIYYILFAANQVRHKNIKEVIQQADSNYCLLFSQS